MSKVFITKTTITRTNPDNQYDIDKKEELYVVDGSGTSPVKIASFTGGSYYTSPLGPIVGQGDRVYFTKYGEDNKTSLWTAGGSSNGVKMIATDIGSSNLLGSTPLVSSGDKVLYFGNTGNSIYAISGAGSAPVKIIDFDAGGDLAETTSQMVGRDGSVFFSGYLGGKGFLWASDGTKTGTNKTEISVNNIYKMATSQGKVHFFKLDEDKLVLYEWDGSQTAPKKIYTSIPAPSPPYFSPIYSLSSENGKASFIDFNADGTASFYSVSGANGTFKKIDLPTKNTPHFILSGNTAYIHTSAFTPVDVTNPSNDTDRDGRVIDSLWKVDLTSSKLLLISKFEGDTTKGTGPNLILLGGEDGKLYYKVNEGNESQSRMYFTDGKQTIQMPFDDNFVDNASLFDAGIFQSQLFTEISDTVDFNNLSSAQINAIKVSKDSIYSSKGGDDLIKLPGIEKYQMAGSVKWNSKNAFDAGKGNDIITSGNGNDIIRGGEGIDTVRFSGKFSDYKIVDLKKTAPSGGTIITVSSSKDGLDTLTDIERIQFSDQTIPLFKWEFSVIRGQDGKIEKIAFLENGIEKFSTKNAAYDDATPINSGTYEAIYRTNRKQAEISAIELSNYQGVTNVAGRTAIQIHAGNYTTDSEGCIVASPRDFLKKAFDRMNLELKFSSDDPAVKGILFYRLPVKIKVNISGFIEQPKINMPKDIVIEDKAGLINSKIYYTQDGLVAGVTKYADVTFTIKGSTAGYGSDFVFGNGVTKVGASTFKTTIEAGKRFDDLPIIILADKKGAAPEANEKISIKIVDIDLYNSANSKGGYSENNFKTLFGLLAGDTSFEVTLKSDANKAAITEKAALSFNMVLKNADQSPDTFHFTKFYDNNNVEHMKDFRPTINQINLDQGLFGDIASGLRSSEMFNEIEHVNSDRVDRFIDNSKAEMIIHDSDVREASKSVHFAELDNNKMQAFQDLLLV